MNVPVLLWLLGSLGLCWLLGVHNRLTRLRAACWDAVGQLDRALQLVLSVAKEALEQPQPVSDGHETLNIAAMQLSLALKDMNSAKLMPAKPGPSLAVAGQWEAFEASWAEFLAHSAQSLPEDALQLLRQRAEEARNQALFARASLAQTVADYSQALEQAPASWVAPVLGFHPALAL
jgi:LemA protein